MRKVFYCLTCLCMAFFVSCTSNPLDVDVSDIEANVQVERFDRDFYSCSKAISFSSVAPLVEKYSGFFDAYNAYVISCGSYSDLAYYDCLKVFFSDYSVVMAYDAVEKEFENCDDVQETINDGFRHLLYYYPEEKLPRVVTFIAGFNQSIVLMDGYVGVGLEKYLGTECPLYDMLQVPDFAKAEMQRKRIPIDIMAEWFRDRYPYDPETENLANKMIYNGMQLYFLEAMFPNMTEADRLTYTEDDLRYCDYYESEIWTSLVENEYLFTTDSFEIKKFTENAPFTSQFGADCPARVVNWIGLQIVKSYVKNNNVKLLDLLSETNYQKILNMSEYSPR